MILVERILGHQSSADWLDALKAFEVDHLILEPWEIGKSRLKKLTENGREIAVSLNREFSLHPGDVLYHSITDKLLIIAKLELGNVMVIELDRLFKETVDKTLLAKRCVELGHGLGNQHWPLIIKDSQIFIPLMVDRIMMESVMKTHGFNDMDYYFTGGDEVCHLLTAAEMRLLFASHEHSHYG